MTISGLSHSYQHSHHNHQVYLVSSTLPLPKSSSHYPGETVIRIDSYPAGGVFLILTQAYFMRAARITFSTTPDQFAGLPSAAPPGTANLLGSGL